MSEENKKEAIDQMSNDVAALEGHIDHMADHPSDIDQETIDGVLSCLEHLKNIAETLGVDTCKSC